MALSKKQLVSLIDTTNQNCERIGLPTNYHLTTDGEPTTYRIMDNQSMIVCAGTLKECDSFLRGVNSILNQNSFYLKNFIKNTLNIRTIKREDVKQVVSVLRRDLLEVPLIKNGDVETITSSGTRIICNNGEHVD